MLWQPLLGPHCTMTQFCAIYGPKYRKKVLCSGQGRFTKLGTGGQWRQNQIREHDATKEKVSKLVNISISAAENQNLSEKKKTIYERISVISLKNARY
jgi:hypothetical protein